MSKHPILEEVDGIYDTIEGLRKRAKVLLLGLILEHCQHQTGDVLVRRAWNGRREYATVEGHDASYDGEKLIIHYIIRRQKLDGTPWKDTCTIRDGDKNGWRIHDGDTKR